MAASYLLLNDMIGLLDIRNVLFGYHKENFDSKINYILLVAKRFIWTTKFNSKTLSFEAFKSILKRKLEELKDSYDYLEKPEQFDRWKVIVDDL